MLEMQAFHRMKEVIEKIICENIPDARCIFDGDSCNFRLVVVSSIFAEMYCIIPTVRNPKKTEKTKTVRSITK